MLRASRLLHARPLADEARWAEARTRLWRSQCNCPYWHGVFGGLYLPHLRAAVYRELIAAERDLAGDTLRVERSDVDFDGVEDALLETPRWSAWISAAGARLWAFDDRDALVNYIDTLARRPEYYHAALREAAVGGGGGESIHAAIRVKDPDVAALVDHYDARGRDAFLDRWHEDGRVRDLSGERFTIDDDGASVTLSRAEDEAPAWAKRYARHPDGGLEVAYTLRSSRARTGRLEVELNLGLHVPRADDRTVEIDGHRAEPPYFAAEATHGGAERIAFIDAWADRRLEVRADRRAEIRRAPIETASLSEAGAERVFQGVETLWTFDVELEPETPWSVRFRLDAGPAKAAS
jgi:alpha-amylase